jgi:hypothetical protein
MPVHHVCPFEEAANTGWLLYSTYKLAAQVDRTTDHFSRRTWQ